MNVALKNMSSKEHYWTQEEQKENIKDSRALAEKDSNETNILRTTEDRKMRHAIPHPKRTQHTNDGGIHDILVKRRDWCKNSFPYEKRDGKY